MPKDRLGELRQKQSENDAEVQINLLQYEDDSKKLRNTFERAEIVGEWVEEIERNVQEARVFIRRIDGVKYNQKDVSDRLQSFFQNNTSIAQRVTAKLKEFSEDLNKIREESAEGRIIKIQYSTLQTRFQKALLDNSKELESYRTVQKQHIKAQLTAKNVEVTDEELTTLLDEGEDLHVFTDHILAVTAEAKRLLADVEERHQQLVQIERMLTEVKGLFVQMAILVDNQQELIDRIEYQAQTATDYIAAVDLESARKSKCKHFKRKLYLLIALVIFIAIVLVLLFKT